MESAVPHQSLREELKDAITARAFLLVAGVLVLQLAFILSYVGAFHAPAPQNVKVAVVAPVREAPGVAAKLGHLPGSPLDAKAAASEDAARGEIKSGSISAALIVNPRSTTDRLLVASGGGAAVATAVQSVVERVEQSQHRTAAVTDVVPLQAGDARGLTGFYLVVGWMVGGYLVASLLGISRGSRPANHRRTIIRLASLVPYAILSGLGGAIIAGPVLGALDGHFIALWWAGALIVFAAAAATTALQILFGVIGIGAAVLLFVVLGNPSAGGAYQLNLVPPFWRAIGYAIPTGAGTDTVRRIVYFGGNGIMGHLLVISAWIVGGVACALLASRLMPHRPAGGEGAAARGDA